MSENVYKSKNVNSTASNEMPKSDGSAERPNLILAAERGRLDIIQDAINAGLDVNVCVEDYNLLHAAVVGGNSAVIELICKQPSCKLFLNGFCKPYTSISWHPLVYACSSKYFKNVDVVKTLVEGGCDPYMRIQIVEQQDLGKVGRTAITYAAECADLATVKYLWDVLKLSIIDRPLINACEGSLLHVAAARVDCATKAHEIIEYIYQCRPEYYYHKNKKGDIPLHYAALCCYRTYHNITQLLDMAGDQKSLFIKNNMDVTPLEYVTLCGNAEAFEKVAKYLPESFKHKGVLKDLKEGRVLKALSDITAQVTTLTTEEETCLSVLKYKLREDDMAKIIRCIKRLGVNECYKYLGIQGKLMVERPEALTYKISCKLELVPKTEAGVYLSAILADLRAQERKEDIDYIYHLSRCMAKRNGGKHKKV